MLTLFVQAVRMRNHAMPETISSGGFSGANAYCRKLVERHVEVCPPPLVLPREAAALPHVGPPVAAGVLLRAAL